MRDFGGKALAGARVAVRCANDLDGRTLRHWPDVLVVSDHEGSFRLGGLHRGSADVSVVAANLAPMKERVMLEEGQATRLAIRLDTGFAVRGTVVAADGRPAHEASIRAEPTVSGVHEAFTTTARPRRHRAGAHGQRKAHPARSRRRPARQAHVGLPHESRGPRQSALERGRRRVRERPAVPGRVFPAHHGGRGGAGSTAVGRDPPWRDDRHGLSAGRRSDRILRLPDAGECAPPAASAIRATRREGRAPARSRGATVSVAGQQP
ncbi:MAG: carboxypeptidase regulatory-like domain-containing protein [Planctomycetes bacterium]|nr:carboxypeptidase regulatory-like domain-containing protein [Planctomycetota bacterium]